jgi:hypothetical protein
LEQVPAEYLKIGILQKKNPKINSEQNIDYFKLFQEEKIKPDT